MYYSGPEVYKPCLCVLLAKPIQSSWMYYDAKIIIEESEVSSI